MFRLTRTNHKPYLLSIITLLLAFVLALCFWLLLFAIRGWAASGVAAPAAQGSTALCFTSLDGTTTYTSSADSQAVRAAIAGAVSNGYDTVKLAGYCAGGVNNGGTRQVALITNAPLTLMGGYTDTDWSTSYPMTQPTTLDARGRGRVIYSAQPLTLVNFVVMRGNDAGNGGGVFAAAPLTMTGMSIISNTSTGEFGGGVRMQQGGFVADSLFEGNRAGEAGGLRSDASIVVSNTRFINNTATSAGGGFGHTNGLATFEGGLFQGNQATGDVGFGGGIYFF